MTYGLDTSVLVRLLMCEPPDLAERVRSRIEDMLSDGADFFISDLVVSETYFSLQHHYRKTKEGAIKSIREVLETPGFSFTAEARAALETPEVWKANPGFIDRILASEYAAKGFVTVSCEKSFRKLDLAEVIG